MGAARVDFLQAVDGLTQQAAAVGNERVSK